MRKIRIGVDIDGVLADLLTPWLKWYNKEYNDNLTNEDIISWDMNKFVKKEAKNKIYDYLNFPNIYDDIKVLDPLSIGVLKEWASEPSLEIFIITSCGNRPNMIAGKLKWLKENYPFLNKRNFVFTDNKGVANVDVMVDDYSVNLDKVFKANDQTYLFLYDSYHNQDKSDDDYVRVKNWKDIENKIIYLYHSYLSYRN